MNHEFINITSDEASFRLWVVQTLTSVQTKVENFTEIKNDQEERIRKIESKMWAVTGAASVISSVLSIVATSLIRKVTQ